MVLPKLLLGVVLVLAAFVLLRAILSMVIAGLSLLLTLIWTAISLAVLLGIGYGAYRLYNGFTSDDSPHSPSQTEVVYGEPASTDRSATTPRDPVERAKQEYASGKISEAELERRLEKELE